MQFLFHHRYTDGPRPVRDAEGTITSLGVFGEHVDEDSTHITENIQHYFIDDPDGAFSPTQLAVGEYVTVEIYRGNVLRVCDLYRVS